MFSSATQVDRLGLPVYLAMAIVDTVNRQATSVRIVIFFIDFDGCGGLSG